MLLELSSLEEHWKRWFNNCCMVYASSITFNQLTDIEYRRIESSSLALALCSYRLSASSHCNTNRKHAHVFQCDYRPVGMGGKGVRSHPPPPQSQKGPPDGIIKYLKWYKTNVVMLGLTIWMHFQQFEDLKFLFFSGGASPRTSLKPLQSVQLPSQIRRDCPDSSWESRVPTRLQSGHSEYPDFKNQLSPANEQRKIFLLNYHNICHKMNKRLSQQPALGAKITFLRSFVAGKANFCCHLLASLVHFTVVKSQAILIIRLGVAEVIYHSSWDRRSYFCRNFISSASFKTTKFLARWICSGTTVLRVDSALISIVALTTTICLYNVSRGDE